MKKKSTLLFLMLFAHIYISYAQQITTDNTQQPNELIQNLVGSDCVTVSNVSSPINGSINNIISYGTFDKNTSNFPLQSGIILSTGRVNSAGNSVNAQDLNEGNIDWVTDPDILDVLGIDQTLNATTIEFDFSSANSFVSFNYLFASDEYQQEFPCNFQDVFAILIKRAGTTDPYINMAVVPETTTEISTNTIHPTITGFCDAENEAYFDDYNTGDTNFNGRTKVLTARADIIPNETYHIKIVIADHIDQRFDSAVFIEAEGFGNSINLGPDQSICGNDLTLNAEIDNAAAIYTWLLNGNPIVGENNSTLNVDASGIYNVEISIPSNSGNCILTDTIEIEIIPFQDAAPIDTINICDPAPSDGVHQFNFTEKDDEIYASLPSTNYIITYHLSEDDAQNNNNSVTGIYENTDPIETIFVRIESLNGDCLQLGSFDILVNASPNTLEFTLDVCSEAILDDRYQELNSLNFIVSNYEWHTQVSYYLTLDNAINEINPLENYPSLTEGIPFFIARVVSDLNGCISYVKVNFDYLQAPELDTDKLVINQCLSLSHFEINSSYTETYNYETKEFTYNLTDYETFLEEQFPGVTFSLYTYIQGYPAITTTNLPFYSATYLASHDNTCYSTFTIEFHKNLLHNVFGEEIIKEACDDSSNDGILDFNLTDIAEELKESYNEISIIFYETEEDLINEENPIDQSLPYTVFNSQELYIASFYNDCSFSSRLKLNILESTSLTPQTVNTCGDYNSEDNTTTIFLQQFNDLWATDVFSNQVQYYLTEENALNDENRLADTYAISGNTQRFYVKIAGLFIGCPDITTLDITIPTNIELNTIEPLTACDDNLDGIEIVNLESIIPVLINDPENYNITFYTTSENAFFGDSEITSPIAFSTSNTEIFVKVEIPSTNCFAVKSFDVVIYNSPHLTTISNFINCELNPNTSSDFLFVNKDLDIINGQPNMQVLYFETEDNAINRIDPIDKNTAYIQTSNPQTIFVRLENEAGNSCFKVAPMQIETRQAPIYNYPTDVFECDINKNGLATTDLNEKITEINTGSSTNLNISFHLTPLSAEVGVNQIPLNYTATNNPQIIYARIVNTNSRCFEIATFSISTLSLPEVTHGQSLIQCGDNYNFTQEWDLTQIELDVLNGRQYNIEFIYFESEDDLLINNNPITNPLVYTNTSNPQTIYAKIKNATTACFDVVPFDLIIDSPPQINAFITYNICENIENTVNLSEINPILVNNTFNVIINYYANEIDAEAKENPLNLEYSYTNTTETLFARVEYSTTHCYAVYPFQLVVNPLPIANQPNNLIACDDDFDGFLEFDLSQQYAVILGNQNADNFAITFYNSEVNAHDKNQPLSTNYIAFNNEIIFVRLENNITGCYDVTEFSIIIKELPLVSIVDQVLCINDLPLIVSAETYNQLDTYLWSTNATSSNIEIFDVGTYSVTITNEFGCENTSTFNVSESQSAIIDIVETIDFSDPNNIIVTLHGIGNYLYQLNSGNFQSTNVFQNVPIGYNTITIIDQNGCAEVTREVLVIDTPKHMTPNNDGDYDTWHITGVETLPGTIISIFNRYGKLLKQLRHNDSGWDGNYNGNKMPSDDYWFVADVVQNGKLFQVNGHFTLKR